MDLLTPSSDDESTLRAVLAFIDGTDYGSLSGSGSSLDVSPSVSLPARQPPRNRKKYTTQLQRKKREEVATLREEVAELEATLAQLRRVHAIKATAASEADRGPKSSASTSTASNKPAPQWREVALDEHRRRRHAELTNDKLKTMLQRHRRLGDAILSILKKRPGDEAGDTALVDAVAPTPPAHLSSALELSVEAQLQNSISMLHAETRLVFQRELCPVSVGTRVSSSFEIVRERTGAVAYIEVRTSTPVAHSHWKAAQTIWRNLVLSGQRKYPNKRHVMVPGRDGLSLEKRFAMLLTPERPTPAACEQQIQLNGMHFVKRFDTPSDSSIAIITSALLLLPASGLQFREHSWIKVCESTSSPSGAVVETCYRVYPGEYRGPAVLASGAGRHETSTQEAAFVLQTLADNTRLGMQATQNTLLSGELF